MKLQNEISDLLESVNMKGRIAAVKKNVKKGKAKLAKYLKMNGIDSKAPDTFEKMFDAKHITLVAEDEEMMFGKSGVAGLGDEGLDWVDELIAKLFKKHKELDPLFPEDDDELLRSDIFFSDNYEPKKLK